MSLLHVVGKTPDMNETLFFGMKTGLQVIKSLC